MESVQYRHKVDQSQLIKRTRINVVKIKLDMHKKEIGNVAFNELPCMAKVVV